MKKSPEHIVTTKLSIMFLIMMIITACTSTENKSNTRLNELQRLHTAMLSSHTYITDIEQYGVNDKWVASLNGDCEDYVLYIQSILTKGEKLIVKTNKGQAHMVLLVDGFVIDNTSKRVYPYTSMTHKLILNLKG